MYLFTTWKSDSGREVRSINHMFFGGGGRHFRFGLFNQGTNCMTYVVVWRIFHSQPFGSLVVQKSWLIWFFKIWQIAFHLSRHDHFFRVISCVSNILTFTGKILLRTILFLVCHKCRGVKNLRKLRSWEFRNSAKKRVKSKGCIKIFTSADMQHNTKISVTQY